MSEPILFKDFETRSAADLKVLGADAYARHPSTDIICLGWALDEEVPTIWYPGMPAPARVLSHVDAGGASVAHNAAFELAIWEHVGVRKYGWPRLTPEQTICTMAMAYAMALPGSLDRSSNAVGLPQEKDSVGHRLMLQLSQPREIKPDGTIVWWEDLAKLERLYDYCIQDIEVERALFHKLVKLTPVERRVWNLDQKINQRGLAVDLPAVKTALAVAELEQERLEIEMRATTENAVATCSAVGQLGNWLRFKGITDFEGVAKADVIELLSRPDLPTDVRKALTLRQEAAKTSTKKLKPMLHSVCDDGRLRGIFQYGGAMATRRWAGRRVQPHNFPRPKMKQKDIEQVLSWLTTDSPRAVRDLIDLTHGQPLTVLADCLRGFLVAGPGKDLIGADFSNVEGRKLAWLAGEAWKIAAFEAFDRGVGADIYVVGYSRTFALPLELVDDPKRQVGKVIELSMGFGGGVGAFQSMAGNYNVTMAPAFQGLWSRASIEHQEKAIEMHRKRGAKFDISKEEYLASELTKLAWRDAHGATVRFWYALDDAARAAVRNPGSTHQVGYIKYRMVGSFLWCKLPSGGALCYPYPRLEVRETDWGDKETLTYMGEDSTTHTWKRFGAYGGLLAENCTQASSRDLLAEAMGRLDPTYPIVAHVHDEAIGEVDAGTGDVKEFETIMKTLPAWAKGMPLAAKGWRGRRYRK